MTKYTDEDFRTEDYMKGFADGNSSSVTITLDILRNATKNNYWLGYIHAALINFASSESAYFSKSPWCLDGIMMAIKEEEFKSNYPSGDGDKNCYNYVKNLMSKLNWTLTSEEKVEELLNDSEYKKGLQDGHLNNLEDKTVLQNLLNKARAKDKYAIGILLAHNADNGTFSFTKGATDALLGNKKDYTLINNAWRSKYDAGFDYIEGIKNKAEPSKEIRKGLLTNANASTIMQSKEYKEGVAQTKVNVEEIQKAINKLAVEFDARSLGLLVKASNLSVTESYLKGFSDRLLNNTRESGWAVTYRYCKGFDHADNFLKNINSTFTEINRKISLEREFSINANQNYLAQEYLSDFIKRFNIKTKGLDDIILNDFIDLIYRHYYDKDYALKSRIDGKDLDRTKGISVIYKIERNKYFLKDYNRGYKGHYSIYNLGNTIGQRDKKLGLKEATCMADFYVNRIQERILENCPSTINKEEFAVSDFMRELISSYCSNKEFQAIDLYYYYEDRYVENKDANAVIQNELNIYESYEKVKRGEIIAVPKVITNSMSGKPHVLSFLDGYTDKTVLDKDRGIEDKFYKYGVQKALESVARINIDKEVHKSAARLTLTKLDILPTNDIFISFIAGAVSNNIDGSAVTESGFDSTYFQKGRGISNWNLLDAFMNHYINDRKAGKKVAWIEDHFAKWIKIREKEESKKVSMEKGEKQDDKAPPQSRLTNWKNSLKPGAVDGLLRFMKTKFISKLTDVMTNKKPKNQQKKYMEVLKDLLESPLGDLVFFSVISEAVSPIGEKVGLPPEWRELVADIARQKVVGEVTYQILDVTSEGLGIGYGFLKEYFDDIKSNKEVIGFLSGSEKSTDLFTAEDKKQKVGA